MGIAVGNLSIDAALASAQERYVKRHPKSAAAYQVARAVMPGGNTRSVLYFDPFPLTLQRGEAAEVWDIDGHRYCDFVGEFSAGLYGHTDPVQHLAPQAQWEGDEVIVPGSAAGRPAQLDVIRTAGGEIVALATEEGRLDEFYRELVESHP